LPDEFEIRERQEKAKNLKKKKRAGTDRLNQKFKRGSGKVEVNEREIVNGPDY